MPLLTQKMPSFQGVAAGQTATCYMPLGRTFHQLLITYSGATLAQLNELRLMVNGEAVQRVVELTELDVINKFEGRAAASGVIVLDLERFGLLTRGGREVTALGTGHPEDSRPVQSLSLEIDIDAAATSPVLSMKALQSPARPSGVIKKVRKHTYTVSATGEFEISDLHKKNGELINRVIFKHASIDGLKIDRNNLAIFDRTAAENTLVQNDGVRVAQSGYFVYDPTENGYGSEGLVTAGVQDLRFILDMSGTGSLEVTVESIAPLEK